MVFAASAWSLSTSAQSPSGAPAPVDPLAFVNQFESTFGKFEGYRRSGANDICATGEFVGNADAGALSSDSVFSGRPVPVVMRFSVGGANPKAPDNGKSQRNMALQFNLELAQAGDRLDSVTVSLPRGRRKVNLGTLKVTSVSTDAGGPCLTITYNPMVMPKGVEPSADPMLAARAAPYAVGLGRRLTEGAKQQ